MSDIAQNNKRIAQNTIMLYIRMLLIMVVTLYTSRIVLDKLGVVDYGIYNVVGGIVAMLGFINGAMSYAVQRFLSFEIGRENKERTNHIFCLSLISHYAIAIFVFIVLEIGGVWYLNSYMNIPPNRLSAANCVLQCSILTTMFTIVQVPYNAIIIAKEQMNIYAYISILEVALKLSVVFLLGIADIDRLKLYSILIMLVTILTLMIYRIYCRYKYEETKFKFVKDFPTLKEILSFASWNMLGELGWVFTGQGVNILLNLFFGPSVNAARGIADQVNGAVYRFIANFQTAVSPQLVKDFAKGNISEMKILLFRSTRFSYYLMFCLSIPLIINMDFILHLWLTDVPEYATIFCQLILISTLLATISNLLSQVARAYGKIRNYQIICSFIQFLNFPVSYIALLSGAEPSVTVFINCCIQFFLLFARLELTKKMINLSILDYMRKVVIPITKVSVLSLAIPIILSFTISYDGWIKFIVICVISIIISAICILIVGINRTERMYILKTMKKYIRKILHKY